MLRRMQSLDGLLPPDRPGTISRWIGTVAILVGVVLLIGTHNHPARDNHDAFVRCVVLIAGGLALRIEAAIRDGMYAMAARRASAD